jgi:predicted lipoprotein with Yx(FWY)xxD motif
MVSLRTGAALASLIALFVCASCGSSNDATTVANESGNEAAAMPPMPTRISTGVPYDRRVMVSKSAKSLYVFEREPKGGAPQCYGKCAKEWPPYLTSSGKLEAIGPMRFDTALLGTVARKGGALQVTYAGYPLYEYAHEGVTETRGFMRDEFGGLWYLIAPDGSLLTRSSSGLTVKKDNGEEPED